MTERMGLIACEICYAEEQDIFVKKLQLPDGASVKVALQKACLGHLIAGIEAGVLKIGTYSKPRILGDVIAAGDRIEIYRPLRADPKLVRKCKVEKQRTENPDRWIRR